METELKCCGKENVTMREYVIMADSSCDLTAAEATADGQMVKNM
jgi:hypothetical protein